MKEALIVVGAVVVCLVAALIVLHQVGFDPRGPRPGQTRSWYGLPHSVAVAAQPTVAASMWAPATARGSSFPAIGSGTRSARRSTTGPPRKERDRLAEYLK
jgi:hypothetical protein